MGRMSRPHSRTGRQRWWVTFQAPVTTFSGANSTPTITFVNTKSIWAELCQTTGQELVWPQQVQAEEMFLIRCRWFAGAAQAQRIVLVGSIFNIVQTSDVGSLHQELEITACQLDPDI